MGIRQRTWTWKGKEKSAWVVEYFDLKGKRRLKTFKTQRAAKDWAAETRVSIKRGTHIADSDTVTVAEAGEFWLETGKENGLVRSSLKQNREHLDLHIGPFIGDVKLSQLSVPSIRAFEGELRADGRSPALTRKVLSSLGGIIADAQERGLAMHNPVREMRANRGKRRTKATRVSGLSPSAWTHPHACRDQGRPARCHRLPAGILRYGCPCRLASLRAAWPQMAGCGPWQGHSDRAPARRRMGRHRPTQERGRAPNGAAAAAGRQGAHVVEAGLPAARHRPKGRRRQPD